MTGERGYLLDTNVLSETRRREADQAVMAFLEAAESEQLYLSVLTVGELRKGIFRKRQEDAAAAARLSVWLEGLEAGFADRILPVSAEVARLWGEWSADRPRLVIDTLMAATAAVHGLTLVTRNVRDVAGLPLEVVNPWTNGFS